MKKKVLIVEDDVDLAFCVAKRLRSSGKQVAQCPNALEAITMVQDWSPDLLVLDLGLPGGSGYSVLEQLNALFPTKRLPVIVMTGQSKIDVELSVSQEVSAIVRKPFDNEEFAEHVERALEPVGT